MAADLRRFHDYPLTFGPLAFAGGNDIKSFQVETGYDFAWLKASAFVFDANGLGVAPDSWPRLTCLLSDGSTQLQISTGEQAIGNLFGAGRYPYILPIPHILRGGQTLTAQVFNRHTATAYSVTLSFSGVFGPVGSGAELQVGSRRRLVRPGRA